MNATIDNRLNVLDHQLSTLASAVSHYKGTGDKDMEKNLQAIYDEKLSEWAKLYDRSAW